MPASAPGKSLDSLLLHQQTTNTSSVPLLPRTLLATRPRRRSTRARARPTRRPSKLNHISTNNNHELTGGDMELS